MSEDFGKRLNIEFRDFDCSDGKRVPDLMELHFLQTVTLDKAREELAIGSRFCRLALAGQEVVRRVVRIKLLDDVAKKRRYRYDSRRGFRFRGADVKICSSFLLVVNPLHRLVDVDRLTFERDVLHLQAAQLADTHACEECHEDACGSSVQIHVDGLDQLLFLFP